MRLFQKTKDGGPTSPVDAYFLCEFKGLFSIALLKFNKGGRESYHTHAFNAWTWFLSGEMTEQLLEPNEMFRRRVLRGTPYKRSLKPKYTPRECLHRVKAFKDSWCLTVRGPWTATWCEYNDYTQMLTVLGNHREVIYQHRVEL